MYICIECNGKSLKFDTIAKIKVTSVLEIFVSLRYVMYIHMICEIKIKTGGHRSYKKMGAVPKVRIGDKTLCLSRSRTLKRIFARYDSVTNTGNVSLYGLQQYDLKYGLSFHIKIRVVSKVSFTCKRIFFLNHKHYFFARFGDITKKGGISTYNLR